MTSNDLTAPLGQRPKRKRRFTIALSPLHVLALALGGFLLTFAGFALFREDPLGGEPMAKVAYDPSKLPGDKTAAATPSAAPAPEAAAKPSVPEKPAEAVAGPGQKTITR